LKQAASRNQRLTQLQEALSERKAVIADLRHQLYEATRGAAAPDRVEGVGDSVAEEIAEMEAESEAATPNMGEPDEAGPET